MPLYPGAELIECEINGRPLYLPLLREGREAVLVDCGTRAHAQKDVPDQLDGLGLPPDGLTWLIITHPDGDHCGGTAEIKQRYPGVRLACGEPDRELVESPKHLYTFRYDAYREHHAIFFDTETERQIRNCSSAPQKVDLTFTGGETLRIGPDRILEIWHLPGHSHGHLGIYDRKYKTLYYGDAVQGAGYRSLTGAWALCPTYLYVQAYLQTIRTIENSPARMMVGCHWPIWRDEAAIRQFCGESRNFVSHADRLITGYLDANRAGITLRELCEQLSPQLGEWPSATSLELANAFSGHLDHGLATGRFEADRSSSPFVYRLKQEARRTRGNA